MKIVDIFSCTNEFKKKKFKEFVTKSVAFLCIPEKLSEIKKRNLMMEQGALIAQALGTSQGRVALAQAMVEPMQGFKPYVF